MPAAVQRGTICPSRQRATLRFVVLAMAIIDSVVILSSLADHRCDLGGCVENGVVDAAA
jgi:hypothetical protein